MGTSLKQGIDAAKAGKLGLALEYLKNAVVEEPENPEVWVWFSGIIDDQEKQIIFLKKALELDPDNKSAQRGLAYLQRQKYVPSQPSEGAHGLSIEKGQTNLEDEDIDYPDPDFLTLNVQSFAKQVDALGDPQAPSRKEIIRESKKLQSKSKKNWLDILIYSLTLIVFTVIGVLIGVTIKNKKTITPPEPKEKAPAVLQLPSEGVFLTVDNQFFKLELSHNEPASGPGLPSTNEASPVLRAQTSVMIPSKLKLLNQKRTEYTLSIVENDDHSFTITPKTPLSPDTYCLVHPFSDENQALYWCFKVID